jgi:hypothetical protein
MRRHDGATQPTRSAGHGTTRSVNPCEDLASSLPDNPENHEVVVESYETDGDVITFHGVTSFDGEASPPWPRGVVTEKGGTILRTHIAGQVEVVG